jgi:hypothetical protein
MKQNNINITIRYTELNTYGEEMRGFRIPLAHAGLYPDIYRDNGYTAKLVNVNRLVLTSPWGHVKEYAIAYEMDGHDYKKMMARTSEQNVRFYRAIENVLMARLENTVRYINRHTW